MKISVGRSRAVYLSGTAPHMATPFALVWFQSSAHAGVDTLFPHADGPLILELAFH